MLDFKIHLKLVKIIQRVQKTNTSEVREIRKTEVGPHTRTGSEADRKMQRVWSFAMKVPDFSECHTAADRRWNPSRCSAAQGSVGKTNSMLQRSTGPEGIVLEKLDAVDAGLMGSVPVTEP